ncbi:MAG TPA: cytochrome c3 family protein [Nitrospirota bacterium]
MNIKAMVMASLCCLLLSLPAAHAEETAPAAHTGRNVVKLDSLSNTYKPVLFNHEMHVGIAGDCGVCHHQHGTNSKLSCRDCHNMKASSFKSTVTSSFMACRNCHGAYDPGAPGMPGLKVAYHRACFQCHRGMGEVGTDPKGCTIMCHDKRSPKVAAKAKQAK